VFWLVGWAITSFFRSRSALIAENLCLRHQLLVPQRRHPRPRLRNADRRFWILACRWLTGWRRSLVIVRPEAVLGWHRKGWKAYWRWRSWPRGERGRRPIGCELSSLIRRMALKNHQWGQRRIQAELARLGFTVAQLAKLSQTAWCGYLGLRLLRRPDSMVPNPLCLFRDPSRKPRSRACPGNSTSNGRVDGAANRGMLRLGP